MEFENRVALVTGASRNIGRATALAFANLGADVAITALNRRDEAESVAAEIRALGRRASVCMVDTSDSAAVADMAKRVSNELGRVDILVLNAAIRPEVRLLDMTYEQWRHVLGVNLDSAFLCSRAFLPGMVVSGWGRIITLGGAGALQRGTRNRAHVGASKGGLLGFTRCLAVELGETGVTVNMVSPGSIATIHEERAPNFGAAAAPMKRLGLPDEIAAACTYLASEGAAYVTGQVLSVNGGLVMD